MKSATPGRGEEGSSAPRPGSCRLTLRLSRPSGGAWLGGEQDGHGHLVPVLTGERGGPAVPLVGAGVAQPQLTPGPGDDAFDQGESEPEARAGPGGRGPAEPVRGGGQHVG